MPAVRRSRQPAHLSPAYQTEDHNVIDMIERALAKEKESKINSLYEQASEIGKAWNKTDNASSVRLAAFGCEILLLVHPLYKRRRPIKKTFLLNEIKELNELESRLLGGIHLSYEDLVFVTAIRDDLYDEWFEAIRKQAKRLMEEVDLPKK